MLAIFICIISFFPSPVIHNDLEQRIAVLTKLIELSPADVSLYLQRGDLYLQHEEYENAKSDYIFCLRHDLKVPRVLSGISTAYHQLHQPDSALYFIDQVFILEPANIPAWDIKVSILESSARYCNAADVLENMIELAPDPTPTLFLRLSSDWKHCDAPGNIDRSISALQNGMNVLNNNYVLRSQLIALYKSYDRFEEALFWQTKMIDHSPTKPRSYLHRAEIYNVLNNKDAALQDLATAIDLIEKMAPQKRDLPAIRELKAEIEQLKKETEKE